MGCAANHAVNHLVRLEQKIYCKISNIRCTKSQHLNVSHLVLQLSLLNPLKPGVKSRMKMYLEQRRQSMLQLHLSDQKFYCLQRCLIYYRFDSISIYLQRSYICSVIGWITPGLCHNIPTTSSICHKMSYPKILQSLNATRFVCRIV